MGLKTGKFKGSLTHFQLVWHTTKAANARGTKAPKNRVNRQASLMPTLRDMVEAIGKTMTYPASDIGSLYVLPRGVSIQNMN